MSIPLPRYIIRLTDVALTAMRDHPEQLLLPIHRRAIYDGLDEVSASTAHRVKVWVGILTVRRVLPYWRPIGYAEEDEYSRIPKRMLEIAEGVLNGTIEKRNLEKKIQLWIEMSSTTGELPESPYYNNWCIFDAGLSVARLVVEPDFWQRVKIDYNTTDNDLHHQDGDAARWASITYAGGVWSPVVKDNRQDDESYGIWVRNTPDVLARRREFWEWWLLKVMSEAWQQGQ